MKNPSPTLSGISVSSVDNIIFKIYSIADIRNYILYVIYYCIYIYIYCIYCTYKHEGEDDLASVLSARSLGPSLAAEGQERVDDRPGVRGCRG